MRASTRRAALSVVAALTLLAPCSAGTSGASSRNMRPSPTAFLELVRSRHSVRAFESRDVPPATLAEILDAANRAPSAGNLQGYEIVVVEKPEQRQRLARAAFGQDFVASAPVVLVFVTDPSRSAAKYGERGATLYSVQDATIAASYTQLAATALGLGSVWVGAFDEAEVTSVVGARSPQRAISLLVLGYPAEAPRASPRRSLSDLVRRGGLETPW